jgi:hypothetical protein
VTELRTSASILDRVPDERLALLMDEAERADDSREVVVALYGVLKPALLAAYEEHCATTNPLVDFPTCRLLRSIIEEEHEQVGWGREALADLASTPAAVEKAGRWAQHLERYLVAADLTGKRPRSAALPRGRSALPEKALPLPARDERFPIVGEYGSLPPGDPQARLLRMMKVRMNELGAAECVAATMVQTSDMPWEYYHQLARHLWDEVRHSAFGEVALREEGFPCYDAFPERVAILDLYFALSPLERYTLLGIAIENGAMKYPPGKRSEYEWCRDEARHPLMTTFQDYDWADEVIHAQIARRWCQPQFGGDGDRMRAVAAELRGLIPVFSERWSWENRAPDVSDARELTREVVEVASPYDAT